MSQQRRASASVAQFTSHYKDLDDDVVRLHFLSRATGGGKPVEAGGLLNEPLSSIGKMPFLGSRDTILLGLPSRAIGHTQAILEGVRIIDSSGKQFYVNPRSHEYVTLEGVGVELASIVAGGSATRFGRIASVRSATFKTHGVNIDPISIPEGRAIMKELKIANPDMKASEIQRYAKEFISSGKEIPSVRNTLPNELLYKVVPKGSTVSKYTPYFITQTQLNILKKSPNNIAKLMGLPKSSQAVKYDIYKITPKQGKQPKTFESTVAPTSEGLINNSGGGKQVIVPNRSNWTTPIKAGEI